MSLLSTPFVGVTTDIVLHSVAFFVMIGGIGLSIWLFWKLHEMPVHKAKQTNKYHKIELVTILTWIGFFIHWVWVVAVIIAFTDFEEILKGVRKTWHDTDPNLEETESKGEEK